MLKIEELEEISADPDFWNDLENAQKVSTNHVEDKIYEQIIKTISNKVS